MGGSNPDSQESQDDSALFSSQTSVPGELVPIPDSVSPNDSNTTSQELESIPDLVSSASLSDSGQQMNQKQNQNLSLLLSLKIHQKNK